MPCLLCYHNNCYIKIVGSSWKSLACYCSHTGNPVSIHKTMITNIPEFSLARTFKNRDLLLQTGSQFFNPPNKISNKKSPPQRFSHCLLLFSFVKTTRNGFEPSTSAVTGRRSNQLSHRAIKGILHTFKTTY